MDNKDKQPFTIFGADGVLTNREPRTQEELEKLRKQAEQQLAAEAKKAKTKTYKRSNSDQFALFGQSGVIGKSSGPDSNAKVKESKQNTQQRLKSLQNWFLATGRPDLAATAKALSKKKDKDLTKEEQDWTLKALIEQKLAEKGVILKAKEPLITKGHVPYGVTDFDQLEATRKAMQDAEQATNVIDDYVGLLTNAMNSPEVEDKSAAVENLSKQLIQRLQSKSKNG